MSTTSMAIFSNPLFASYSVYERNASILPLTLCSVVVHAPKIWTCRYHGSRLLRSLI